MADAVRPHHVLLLSLTPLRVDHLSCYGYSRDTTPNLDEWAAEGTLFEQAYSPAGWTVPAHASVLTGLYPSRHEVFSDGTRLRRLVSSLPTLPELLAGRGYRTAAFVNSGLLGSRTGLDRGFQEFYEVWRLAGGNEEPARPRQPTRLERIAGRAPRLKKLAKKMALRSGLLDLGAPSKAWFTRASVTTRHVIDWLGTKGRGKEPFFLFLHYGDPHYKCYAPFPYGLRYVRPFSRGIDWLKIDRINENPFLFMTGDTEVSGRDFEVLRALYDGEVHYLDRSLGKLFAFLRRTGLLDQTLVMVFSHHGTNLGEHGLGSHAACLYETLVHVPLILRCPDLVPARTRTAALVELTDILPTVLAATGEYPGGFTLHGHSLAPLRESPARDVIAEWRGEDTWYFLKSHVPDFVRETASRSTRGPELERFVRSLQMIRAGDDKYLLSSDGNEELFDLAVDPEELRDLSAREPERTRVMADRLRSRFGKTVVDRQREEARPSVLDGLRDMGYKI